MTEITYRHEYKYPVTAGQMAILKSRAEAVMQRDRHVNATGTYAGFYNIRSVYFDDRVNTCYFENESGTDPREKFRIRIYNHADTRIMLECKRKCRGKGYKESCRLTRQQCDTLLSEGCLPESPEYPAVLQKLLLLIKTRGFRPVVIVEYDRVPYVYPVGNVRITLDCNIRASNDCSRFFEKDISMRSILPTGQHILEVKWDELLPDHIYRCLMLESLQWSSFSKFYLCRRATKEEKP